MEYSYREELYHYGLKGMKWGTRRWQNEDGTFNAAGKERYFADGGGENYHKIRKSAKGNARRALAKVYEINEKFYSKNGRNKALASANKAAKNQQLKKAEEADRAKAEKKALKNTPEERAKRAKRAAIAGAAVVAAGLAAYGGYKLYSKQQSNKAMQRMISEEAARERRIKGEQAIRAMYDKMAMEAMARPGAKSYEFHDEKLGYHIKMGKP